MAPKFAATCPLAVSRSSDRVSSDDQAALFTTPIVSPAELAVKIFMSGAWGVWPELLSLTHGSNLGSTSSTYAACQRCSRGRRRTLFDSRYTPFRVWHRTRSSNPTSPSLDPHFLRQSHLSVDIACTQNVVAVLDAARSGMQSLESLHIRKVLGSLVSVDKRVALDDSGIPLHTPASSSPELSPSNRSSVSRSTTFLEAIISSSPRWNDWVVDGTNSVFPSLRLPSLRHCLRITMYPYSNPPALFIPGLGLPPDVRIDLDWNDVHDRSTHALLPRHLVGLHASPFFDAICVYLPAINSVIVNCFVGGAERVSAFKRGCARRRGFDNPYKSFINGDHLRRFVAGCPNLRRLDLLGKAIRDVKIQMAKAFLDLLAESDSKGAPPSSKAGYLAFGLEVEERPTDAENLKYQVPDENYYSAEYQIAVVREQLDQCEALLTTHLAERGSWIPRLELCVTIVQIYYRIADVPPSSHWTRKLSWFYLPRFQALVDEVVFFGDSRNPRRVLEAGLVRQLTEPKAQTPTLAERGRKTQRRAR
ncbi:hypothetical protein LXA43DRAFT_1094500 [Ganoderma leucocontextum]|nr:hypothetical protein LXA43DRAFT_1094500 [Ganoderma leucocontextum]